MPLGEQPQSHTLQETRLLEAAEEQKPKVEERAYSFF